MLDRAPASFSPSLLHTPVSVRGRAAPERPKRPSQYRRQTCAGGRRGGHGAARPGSTGLSVGFLCLYNVCSLHQLITEVHVGNSIRVNSISGRKTRHVKFAIS